MILDERGAAKALKEAWKEGYIISPGREMMNIYTAKWAVVAPVRMLPLQVSQALVEHVGHIPVDPEKVKKGEVKVAHRVQSLQPFRILQARILEWVAFPFSRGSSQPRNQTGVSCIAGVFFTN